MREAIIVFGVIGIFLTLAYMAEQWASEQCPRMIAGYNCKGDSCDHSPEAIRQALRDQIINRRQF